MSYRFCSDQTGKGCGNLMTPKIIGGVLKFKCNNCGLESFPKPKDTMLVKKENPTESELLQDILIMADQDNTISKVIKYCSLCNKTTIQQSLILGTSHQAILLCPCRTQNNKK